MHLFTKISRGSIVCHHCCLVTHTLRCLKVHQRAFVWFFIRLLAWWSWSTTWRLIYTMLHSGTVCLQVRDYNSLTLFVDTVAWLHLEKLHLVLYLVPLIKKKIFHTQYVKKSWKWAAVHFLARYEDWSKKKYRTNYDTRTSSWLKKWYISKKFSPKCKSIKEKILLFSGKIQQYILEVWERREQIMDATKLAKKICRSVIWE